MANPKSQIIENAQRYAASGKINEAIAEWERLLSDTAQAQDGNIYNTISDLYLRKNDKENAIQTCLKAAQVYKESGFELKGVAVLKKIFKIDPDRVDIHERLADINVERGLTVSAIEGYQKTVKLYMQQGNFSAAIAVYKKLSRFSPEDPEIPLAIARLHQKQEQNREAILAYEQAEAIYEGKNMASEANRVVEEIVKLNPNYIKHLAKKEASVAELDAIVSPKDAVLSVTSSQQEVRGFPPPVETYSEISSLNMGVGGGYPSLLAAQEGEVYTQDTSFFKIKEDLLEGGALSETGFKGGAEVLPAVPVSTPSVQKVVSPEALPPLPPQVKLHTQSPPRREMMEVSEVIFRAHLAEVDVYLRYGLNQNAIEKLILAKELDPTREEPYLRLREIYVKEGENEKAAHESLALMKLYEQQNRHDKKEALLDEVRAASPYTQNVAQGARGVPSPPLEPSSPLPSVQAGRVMPIPAYEWSAPDVDRRMADSVRPVPAQASGPLDSDPPSFPFPSDVARKTASRGPSSSGSRLPVDSQKGEEGYFDFASEMESEFGDPAQDAAMPFPKAARMGDPVRGNAYEDKRQQYIESCYHLGIAHKEMGNYEKSVRELQQALPGSRGQQFQEILVLLASCYAESGYVAQAIEILQGGLNDPRCDADLRPSLQYELASYFEKLGDKERSFTLYKEIHRMDPNFKDVSGKVKEIPYRKAQDLGRLRERHAMDEDKDPATFEAAFRKVESAKDKRRISYV